MLTHDDVKRRAKDDGIEFFLAQFVDMNGKPSAKLMPIQAIDDMLTEGAGFAGFAAGPMGQSPASPDMLAIPDISSYTKVPWQDGLGRFACDVTVEGEPWLYCPRTILRNAIDRAAKLGYRMKIGLEAEFFLVRKDENGRLVVDDPLDTVRSAVLRRQGAVPQLRVPDDALEVRQRPRLGELRERPRGRERPVRVELRVRRRPRHVRSRDLLPLHGPRHGAAARQARDVHAEAVLEPDRQRLPLPHLAVGPIGRAEPVRRSVRPAGLRPVGARLPVHRRRARPCVGCLRGGRADRELVQADRRRRADLGRDLVSGVRGVGRQQPHADDPRARRAALRAPLGRRLGQPVPGRRRDPRAPASTASSASSIPARATPTNLYTTPLEEVEKRGIKSLPSHLLEACEHLRNDEVLRDWFGHTGTEHYSDYIVQTKVDEFNAYHGEVSQWEVDRYLTAF